MHSRTYFFFLLDINLVSVDCINVNFSDSGNFGIDISGTSTDLFLHFAGNYKFILNY